jgi:hypothetical protein
MERLVISDGAENVQAGVAPARPPTGRLARRREVQRTTIAHRILLKVSGVAV